MTKRLLAMNGLAILSVILFHSAGWGYTAMFAWTPRYLPVNAPNFDQIGTLPYYLFRLIDQLVVFSIPAFLFVSGAFVAFSQSALARRPGMRKLWNRVKGLLFPYLIWSTLIILLRTLDGNPPGVVEIGRMLLIGASTPAYYYVPLLIQLVLISPIVLYLADEHPRPLLIFAAIGMILVNLLPYVLALAGDVLLVQGISRLLPKWFFFTRLFWFAGGMMFARHIASWRVFFDRWRWAILALTALCYIAGFLEWELLLRLSPQPWMDHRETLIDTVYSMGVIGSLLGFADVKLPGTNFLNSMGSRSFGIYLAHIPVMEIVARGAYHSFPFVLGFPVVLVGLLILLGLGVPLVAMKIFRSTLLVRAYPLVFG
jgi:peptidoglycan/LPS O-acetylase OafA/YrhL